MTNEELKVQAKEQEQKNSEFLQKILPDVQKEMDAVCQKYGVMLGANIIITKNSIQAVPAITVANQTNPYKQS